MDGQTIVQLVSAVGFPAAFALVIFIAYEKRGQRMEEIIRANTAAFERLAMMVEQLTRAVERLEAMERKGREG